LVGNVTKLTRRFPAMAQNVELLERVPLFAGASRDVLEQISKIAEEIDLPAETALTHEGRHEGYFFVVISGTVRIERGGRTINQLGPGDFLGEIALLDGGPRTATATTASPCRLLSLRHEAFRELVDTSPEVRSAILEAAGRHLRAMDEESVI
jgi:CRP/FNR family cyclic AMP-dependent transcriptional regulator